MGWHGGTHLEEAGSQALTHLGESGEANGSMGVCLPATITLKQAPIEEGGLKGERRRQKERKEGEEQEGREREGASAELRSYLTPLMLC